MAGALVIVGLCLLVTIRRRQRRGVRSMPGSGGYNEEDGFTFDSKPYSDVDNDDLQLDDDDELDDDDLNDGVELSTMAKINVV